MLEEEAGVMRNAMTTRAPCGAKKNVHNFKVFGVDDVLLRLFFEKLENAYLA